MRVSRLHLVQGELLKIAMDLIEALEHFEARGDERPLGAGLALRQALLEVERERRHLLRASYR